MFSMPLVQDGLGSNPGGEGLITSEQLPIVPILGAQGEMVYYVPGSAPGITSIAPNGAVRLDTLQNDGLFGEPQVLQQCQPDSLLVHHVSNGFVPLNGRTLNPLQPVDAIPTQTHHCQQHPPGSVATSTQINQFTKSILFPSTQGSTDFKDRLTHKEILSVPFLQNKESCKQNISSSGANNDPDPVMSVPNLMKMSCYSKVQQCSFEQQNVYSKSQESVQEFGPVEKAIFNQALSVRNRKRNIESVASSATQKEVPELQLRSKKHSRAMFETQTVEGGNPCSRLIGYNLIGYGSSNVTSVFHDSKSLNANCLDSTSKPEKVTSKALKPPVLPNIRYHPYPSSESRQAKNANSDTASVNILSQNSPDKQIVTHAIVSTSDVHSVSVPRDGSFTITKSSSDTQPTSRSLGEDVSNFTQEIKSPSDNVSKIESKELGESTDSSVEAVKDNLQAQEDESSNSQEQRDSTIDDLTEGDGQLSPKRGDSTSPPPREVNLPNPLPNYITKIDKPPSRVLKESLHCTTCDVYVNSDNQMKQHINSLRHKNTLQGIPIPAKPVRDEKPKLRADQYRCSVCKVTLNSDIQLSQHLASQRHKNMLEGKPPKPRWSPYDRQQALLHSATGLRLPFKTLPTSPLLASTQGVNTIVNTSVPLANGLPALGGVSTLPRGYLTTPPTLPGAAHLKQASLVLSDGGVLQAREIVYVGAHQLGALSSGTQIAPTALPATLIAGQQQVQLQPLMASQPSAVDWFTANGVRLAT